MCESLRDLVAGWSPSQDLARPAGQAAAICCKYSSTCQDISTNILYFLPAGKYVESRESRERFRIDDHSPPKLKLFYNVNSTKLWAMECAYINEILLIGTSNEQNYFICRRISCVR